MRRLLPEDRFPGYTNLLTGLDLPQVLAIRERFGPNVIVSGPPISWRDTARDTLRDPMLWFLAGTALLFLAVGDTTEAIVLLLAVIPILSMDFYLHRRTQASTEALAGRLTTTIRVLRESKSQEIPAVDLVPGDLVILEENQSIPADGILVAGGKIQIDESALTGEALPVRKALLTVPESGIVRVMVQTSHWAFAGTRVLTGQAVLQVVFTGADTYYGELARSWNSGKRDLTPLQRQISALTKWLVLVAVAFCLVLAAIRVIQGHGFVDAIISATTLAVAALPEEFPIVFTFFLGVGVYRLAREKALVRRAVVVENIGRVTCICSDKTGTLTEGRLKLAHAVSAPNVDRVTLLRTGASASRSASGDPIDAALLDEASPIEGTVLGNFPFTENRRRETSVIHSPPSGILCLAKGAPETIIKSCQLSDQERVAWLSKTKKLAESGHKVIACSRKGLAQFDTSEAEPAKDCDFLGLIAFEDPVRDGVVSAVADARLAGIRVIIVTGDHPETARSVAQAIGLGTTPGPRVINGDELSEILQSQGVGGLHDVSVIARAMPSEKLALVQALQESGEIVAVTGDGVNDVPALQRADVGIAMGERGTKPAREAASIVLMDDNFRTIVRAIAEGKQLLFNLRLSFAYLLMVHIALVASAAWIPLRGFPLLYLPVHIVWLELIIHPTALFAFQKSAKQGLLSANREGGKSRFFSRREWAVVVMVGFILTLVLILGYERALLTGKDVAHARTMALVALIFASATITISLSGSLVSGASLISGVSTLVSVLLIQLPWISQWLHLTPLHLDDWIYASAGGVVVGLGSALFRRVGG